MRRTAATTIAVAVLMGTAGVASTEDLTGPSGLQAGQPSEWTSGYAAALRLDDVWVDAERTFVKVDADADGLVNVDEYAAQAVVFAGLARGQGVVAIDGREPVRLGVPRSATGPIGPAERAAIDAVARSDFYAAAADGLSLGDWIGLRVEAFARADADEDGQLTGRELETFASAVARYDAARG